MGPRSSRRRSGRSALLTLVLLIGLVVPIANTAAPALAAPAVPVSFTILHTNDFHGQLEPSGSNPGAARVANTINNVRNLVPDANLLVFDGGDIMQGSLLSNLQKGVPTIAYYNAIGYDAATFGNHEFDWGQTVIGSRMSEAAFPFLAANVTLKDGGGNCTWTSFGDAAYQIFTVGTAPNTVNVGVIGVTSMETPFITIAEATAGLCFRDPAESILHYYDEVKAQADVMVVLSHIGNTDGGYGYGFPVYGDQTLAGKLNTAGKPVNLIIGGHSHTDLSAAQTVGTTKVVQAHYNGRKVGRADITVGTDGSVTVNWTRLVIGTSDPKYLPVDTLITGYTSDPAYQALVNQPIGYAQMDLMRNYEGDAIMGDFVDDAIYGALNTDADPANDVDVFFNNPGGIRTDWCDLESPAGSGNYIWASSGCTMEGVWAHDPLLLTYGNMFTILPFGNATAVGEMSGAAIYELLQQAAGPANGRIQPSGLRYSAFEYQDPPPPAPTPYTYAWGAYAIQVYDKASATWLPLDLTKTYKVGTNEFLAPAGQDGFTAFKYMKNVTYWGDMLNAVNAYVSAHYGTPATAYKGPNGNGTLDGRITRNGDADYVYEPGEIVPLTILHHNDSHGNLLKGSFVGYTQLVTMINQERAHNPGRTLLLSSGDNIQGDAMMYYFKSAGLGYAADGTPLACNPDPALDLCINPLVKAFNYVGYDAMTLGNHEFNFGSQIFSTLSQATFPILQANLTDTGAYGIAAIPVEPFVEKTVGPEMIDVAILGIGNHRVPNYELPSNIPGLGFPNPITTAQGLAPGLAADNDVVIALTHIGFTENPASVEVDTNVDTYFAAQVPGVDAVIGGHSHTNPASGFGPYKYLPTTIEGPDGGPVLVTQAYRYNNTLGQVILGLLPDGSGGWDVISRAGRYLSVSMSTAEDPTIKALIDPYNALLSAYNNTVLGQTLAPIDALQAFTQETNAANLQADASVAELESWGIAVDFHLSGAMTNKAIAAGATPASPVTLKVSDMFTLMPYENSLVVMEMNGPQIKTVLERAYRNFYYYKYVPGYGGYSYYTTCMLDTNSGNQIVYRDTYPALPNGNNVLEFRYQGVPIDFADASTYYRVSTVNYLAAGSCNFNDSGATLWPLGQITNDTQYYVRDAVIHYIPGNTPVNPQIEGRIAFPPVVGTPVITQVPPTDGWKITVAASFTDPADDPTEPDAPYTCAVSYGDGTGLIPGTVAGMTCEGPLHVYAHAGTYIVTVYVTDSDGFTGWAATSKKVFVFAGFYPPLRATGNVAKGGSTIPVKFRLDGYQGMDIFLAGSPSVAACTGGAPEMAAGKLLYDPRLARYQFNWQTVRGWTGCKRLTLSFVDGTVRTVDVLFRMR